MPYDTIPNLKINNEFIAHSILRKSYEIETSDHYKSHAKTSNQFVFALLAGREPNSETNRLAGLTVLANMCGVDAEPAPAFSSCPIGLVQLSKNTDLFGPDMFTYLSGLYPVFRELDFYISESECDLPNSASDLVKFLRETATRFEEYRQCA